MKRKNKLDFDDIQFDALADRYWSSLSESTNVFNQDLLNIAHQTKMRKRMQSKELDDELISFKKIKDIKLTTANILNHLIHHRSLTNWTVNCLKMAADPNVIDSLSNIGLANESKEKSYNMDNEYYKLLKRRNYYRYLMEGEDINGY